MRTIPVLILFSLSLFSCTEKIVEPIVTPPFESPFNGSWMTVNEFQGWTDSIFVIFAVDENGILTGNGIDQVSFNENIGGYYLVEISGIVNYPNVSMSISIDYKYNFIGQMNSNVMEINGYKNIQEKMNFYRIVGGN